MKQLILKVKDKAKVHNLNGFCHIVYVSKLLNVIGVEILEKDIHRLKNDPNIISFRESEEGKFQPYLVLS